MTCGTAPLPESATVCVLLFPLSLLSVIVRAAVRVLAAVGLNVTLMAQLRPGLIELPHRLVSAKSPPAEMLKTARLAAPVLVRVTVCAGLAVPTVWLAKVRLDGVRLASGPLPVPFRLAVCVLEFPFELSATVRTPARVPLVVGVKVTLIVQLTPGLTEAPQALVTAKSPLAVTLVILSAAAPVLLSVTAWAGLVDPTAWLAKDRLAGASPATATMPVPVKLAVWVLPALPLESSVTVRIPLRAPAAVGLKVTLIVQLMPAATEVPQLLV